MNTLLRVRPWVLATIGYALVAAALIIVAANIVVWLWPARYKDPANLAVAAALVAVAGMLLSMQWRLSDKQMEQSAFFLDRSLAGWDRARDILKESITGPTLERRTKWLAAARILERSRRLTERVTDSAHKDVLEIELTHQRHRFHEFFEQPGPYYYGVNPANLDNVPVAEKMNEAAKQSTQGEGTTISTLRQVPESAIVTIWRALQYPSDYHDVIDRADQFEDGPRLFLDAGLQEYIGHSRTWQSVAGKLWPRDELPNVRK